MIQFRPIGVFGPSFVGKTTFVRYLASNPAFRRATIWTTRSRRPGEQDQCVSFTTESLLLGKKLDSRWIVQHIGPYVYAIDTQQCEQILREAHLLIEIAPSTREVFERNFTNLLSVKLWPDNFGVLESLLKITTERPLKERIDRIQSNRDDADESLCADLEFIVKRFEDNQRRVEQWRDMELKLLTRLQQP